MRSFTALFVGLTAIQLAVASRFGPNNKLRQLPAGQANTSLTASTYYFDQLIDHNNPSLGTFKQMYFFTEGYWTQQGSPIVIMNPGEQSADGFIGYLTAEASIQRSIMQSIGGAGVVLEPIEDTKYFVGNVELPWSKNGTTSGPDDVPWVDLGCSYPGVLAAYTQEKYPDTFAAAWASSAPVQAIGDFWQYFEPIEEGMPKNCSADAALVIKTVDQILLQGNDTAKKGMKTSFGLQDLQDDDFAEMLATPIYPWQSMQAEDYAKSGQSPFYTWCDALETLPDGSINRNASGVGLPTALNNYAKYVKENYPDRDCPGGGCYTSYDYTSAEYTDLSVGNAWDRQWYWMICTEFGFWQDGDPGNYSSIVSSLVTQEFNLRQCNHIFPNADGSPGDYSPSIMANNIEHEGWNLMAEHLFVVNSQFDPWRSASLSSIWNPDTFPDTPWQEVELVAGGHHCWDWDMSGAKYDPDIKRVLDKGIKVMRQWVGEWYDLHPNVANTIPAKIPDYWGNILN